MNTEAAEVAARAILELGKDVEWQGRQLLFAVTTFPRKGDINRQVSDVRKSVISIERAASALMAAIEPSQTEDA